MGDEADDVVAVGHGELERLARTRLTAAVDGALVGVDLQRVYFIASGSFESKRDQR